MFLQSFFQLILYRIQNPSFSFTKIRVTLRCIISLSNIRIFPMELPGKPMLFILLSSSGRECSRTRFKPCSRLGTIFCAPTTHMTLSEELRLFCGIFFGKYLILQVFPGALSRLKKLHKSYLFKRCRASCHDFSAARNNILQHLQGILLAFGKLGFDSAALEGFHCFPYRFTAGHFFPICCCHFNHFLFYPIIRYTCCSRPPRLRISQSSLSAFPPSAALSPRSSSRTSLDSPSAHS